MNPHDAKLRKTIKEARKLAHIVQGTMSLEGQGLDPRQLHDLRRRIVLRLMKDTGQCLPSLTQPTPGPGPRSS